MNLKTDLLRADGYTEDEIQQIQAHCDLADATGRFSRQAAMVRFGRHAEWCCRGIAEIMDEMRPGC